MGYDISLVGEDGESVQVERFSEGGVQPVGGSTNAEISITYNYSKFMYNTIDKERGIRWIYDRPAGHCIDRLKSAITILGTYQDDYYWKSAPGNAGHILSVLMAWAKQYQNATFGGD